MTKGAPMRTRLNMTVGELDALRRLEEIQREIGEIADALIDSKTSKREERRLLGGRLNAAKASLKTVEMRLAGEL